MFDPIFTHPMLWNSCLIFFSRCQERTENFFDKLVNGSLIKLTSSGKFWAFFINFLCFDFCYLAVQWADNCVWIKFQRGSTLFDAYLLEWLKIKFHLALTSRRQASEMVRWWELFSWKESVGHESMLDVRLAMLTSWVLFRRIFFFSTLNH